MSAGHGSAPPRGAAGRPRPRPFDHRCRACPRLVAHLAEVRAAHPGYHACPVPAFGAPDARLLVVGLAPGLHGANASGRPFTGDDSGRTLYPALHGLGFASSPVSDHPGDGLQLHDCRITNAVRCLPPGNRPTAAEVRNCSGFLRHELESVPVGGVILALGRVAHEAVVRAEGLPQRGLPFRHGAAHPLPRGRTLLDSYHCSRYNMRTGRLTEPMFRRVLETARRLLDGARPEIRKADP